MKLQYLNIVLIFEIINNMKENTASENATTWYNWNIKLNLVKTLSGYDTMHSFQTFIFKDIIGNACSIIMYVQV